MSYSFLSPHLQSLAEAIRKCFKKNHGIGSFRIEEAISKNINFSHTLVATTKDYHFLCIEVSENAYLTTLDAIVLEYRDKSLPVKLYVAVPKDHPNTEFQLQLSRARQHGVGVIEVDDNGCDIIQEALSQSLAGVRSPDGFPSKYREGLTKALHTFRNGDPAKGCSAVYDEIEALSRKVAAKTHAKGWWKTAPTENIQIGRWAKVMREMMNNLDYKKCPPKLTHVLIARIVGVTAHRNETGHKPGTKAALINRDRQLRTRFESATDLLRDLIDAGKPLRV